MFKNLTVYRLNKTHTITETTLEAALSEKRAKPCGPSDLSTYGFVAPIGRGENAPLLHMAHGAMLIAAQSEQRILPASVIKAELDAKVLEIEQKEMRKVYRKEKNDLKATVVAMLLPRAFTKTDRTEAVIDLALRMVIVNTASDKKAEELLSTLRELLGALPVRRLETNTPPTVTMTSWLKGVEPIKFVLGDRVTMEGGESEKVVTTALDPTCEEIAQHLETGKNVTKLALEWGESLSFQLDKKLVMRGMRFSDLLKEQIKVDGDGDALAEQDADFALQTLTLRDFLPDLIREMGGEANAEA